MKTETKYVAILDRCTCIPMLLMRFHDANPREEAMFSRAGFGGCPDDRYTYWLDTCNKMGDYADYRTASDYTVGTAIKWIKEHWDEVESGSAVDAEYIRGEVDTPKRWEAEFSWEMMA